MNGTRTDIRASRPAVEDWPALPLEPWKDTCETLHMWTQIVGKVRLALTPLVNHWWNVTLYVSPRGLTTSRMPYDSGSLEIDFDFIDHQLYIRRDDGHVRSLPLFPRTVADFFSEFQSTLESMGVRVKIWPMPSEIPNPIRFDQDTIHKSYDANSVNTFWHILENLDSVLLEFRAPFIGKCSPIHFFWGSFDFCVSRFSGRRAPERQGADRITREAYSHEVISAGWWPGSGKIAGPAFYAYAAPEPKGFAEAKIAPEAAYYDRDLGEFVFMYDDMRKADSPRAALLDFLQSTYAAGANLGNWDRKALERE